MFPDLINLLSSLFEALVFGAAFLASAKLLLLPKSGALSLSDSDDSTGGLSEPESSSTSSGSSAGSSACPSALGYLFGLGCLAGGGFLLFGNHLELSMAAPPPAVGDSLDPKKLGKAYENYAVYQYLEDEDLSLVDGSIGRGDAQREVTLKPRSLRKRRVNLCRAPWPDADMIGDTRCRYRTVGRKRTCRVDLLTVDHTGQEVLVEFKLYKEASDQRELGRLANQAACFVQSAHNVDARLIYVCGNRCEHIEHLVGAIAKGSSVIPEFWHSYCPECLQAASREVENAGFSD